MDAGVCSPWANGWPHPFSNGLWLYWRRSKVLGSWILIINLDALRAQVCDVSCGCASSDIVHVRKLSSQTVCGIGFAIGWRRRCLVWEGSRALYRDFEVVARDPEFGSIVDCRNADAIRKLLLLVDAVLLLPEHDHIVERMPSRRRWPFLLNLFLRVKET